jgi:hypothetical protein
LEWEYEPDETPKRKHSWDKDEAGFVTIGGAIVGKCPQGISNSSARELLNAGIQWSPRRWEHSYPKRIYTIHQNVVYRAMPTNPGKSYHGFPEHPDLFWELPGALRKKIFEHAERLGCLEGVHKWLKI